MAPNARDTSAMEQRSNIKFCFQLGKSVKETCELLHRVYGDNAVTSRCVRKWFERFREGTESVEDSQRSGRPVTSRSSELIEKVAELIRGNRRLPVRAIAEQLDVSKSSVWTILRKDLAKRKVCSVFVPHLLSDDNKKRRFEAAGDFIDLCDSDPSLLQSIVTGDETWCLQLDPLTKRQSMEWRSTTSPRTKKPRLEKSRVKTMLIAFFDHEGIIHKEFVLEGHGVNGAFYLEVLTRLLKRIARVRPHLRDRGWCLLHDNAPAHCARPVKDFLARRGVVVLKHPPYSPDLAPSDFFLFPKLKAEMRGTRFQSIPDIQRAVTQKMNQIPKELFADSFQSLYRRCQDCVVANGDYFEYY